MVNLRFRGTIVSSPRPAAFHLSDLRKVYKLLPVFAWDRGETANPLRYTKKFPGGLRDFLALRPVQPLNQGTFQARLAYFWKPASTAKPCPRSDAIDTRKLSWMERCECNCPVGSLFLAFAVCSRSY